MAWVNPAKCSNTSWHNGNLSTLVQIMACYLMAQDFCPNQCSHTTNLARMLTFQWYFIQNSNFLTKIGFEYGKINPFGHTSEFYFITSNTVYLYRQANCDNLSFRGCDMYTWEWIIMMSSNGNIFRVTGLLCGEFTGDRWIPRTKASESELWCFLRSATE